VRTCSFVIPSLIRPNLSSGAKKTLPATMTNGLISKAQNHHRFSSPRIERPRLGSSATLRLLRPHPSRKPERCQAFRWMVVAENLASTSLTIPASLLLMTGSFARECAASLAERGRWKSLLDLRLHSLTELLLSLRTPIAAIQLNEHRRVGQGHIRLQDDDPKPIACLVQPPDQLFVRNGDDIELVEEFGELFSIGRNALGIFL